jgi:aldose 1-epimerase
VVAPSGEQYRLAAGSQQLVVVEVGGGIRSYKNGGMDVIDGYRVAETASGGRGQLLAPWPNRLEDGSYEWQGVDYQAALSEPEAGNAIHGLVRWSPWVLVDSSSEHLRLEHRLHPQPGWGWTLDLAVEYHLAGEGLRVRTEATNRGPGSCPFGVGWHPYLSALGATVDDLLLTVAATDAYRADHRGLPTGRFGVEGTPQDFRTGRLVGDARLDTAFTNLIRDGDGRATVELRDAASGYGSRLWVDRHYTHLMIYSGDTLTDPARRRHGLAVEPMTCAPNMLRSGDGRLVLERDRTFEAWWGVETFGWNSRQPVENH